MDVRMDWGRAERTGVPEAVLCGHKSLAQIETIVGLARQKDRRLLLTRLDGAVFAALRADIRADLDYDALSRTAVFGGRVPLVSSGIGIVAAGTSDMPVALEANRALSF